MRILLAVHNVYTEDASGAARSMRTIVRWLADAGHTCRALSTARFESTKHATLDAHLAFHGLKPDWTSQPGGCREGECEVDGVGVSILETAHNDLARIDLAEARQYLDWFNDILDDFRPDLVLSYGGHPVLQSALRDARAHSVTTVFSLRNHGYHDRYWFDHADRVLTSSRWLARHYTERIGLRNTALPSPVIWADVQGPVDTRGFLTFINPSPHKGVALFARLADRLGHARPDIPILVVQSTSDATGLASARGLNLARFPQVVISQPIAQPRDMFGLTRVLLVPSLFQEPFGRVAAEAMINGIPAIVSDRGGLPETVEDGAVVLPVPAWMGAHERRVPEAAEVEPWFDAVVRLWDDPTEYQRIAAAARSAAVRLYDETSLRQRYEAYFTASPPYSPLFDH